MPQPQLYEIRFSTTFPKLRYDGSECDILTCECSIEELSALTLCTLFDLVWIESVEVSVSPHCATLMQLVLIAEGFTPLCQVFDMDRLIQDKLAATLEVNLEKLLYMEVSCRGK